VVPFLDHHVMDAYVLASLSLLLLLLLFTTTAY